jgi:hypothetical protein
MCRYFSCIITSDFKVYWLKSSVDHESILASIPIEDLKDQDQLGQRKFVKIEIIPKDEQKITRNRGDWQFKVDEDNTHALPEWFLEHRKKAEKACWTAWEQSVKINLALNDESILAKDDMFVRADGHATVRAYGNATVEAYGNATVRADGHATVRADGNATVEADGNATVEAYGNATVEADGHATVRATTYFTGKFEIKSTTATIIKDGKVYVHEKAEIVKVKEA